MSNQRSIKKDIIAGKTGFSRRYINRRKMLIGVKLSTSDVVKPLKKEQQK